MSMIYIIFVWILLCLLVAKFASDRGRYGFGFFWLAIFVSPLIAGLILFVLPKNQAAIERNRAGGSGRECPYCAEIVQRKAIICRYCGQQLPAFVPGGDVGQEASDRKSRNQVAFVILVVIWIPILAAAIWEFAHR